MTEIFNELVNNTIICITLVFYGNNIENIILSKYLHVNAGFNKYKYIFIKYILI